MHLWALTKTLLRNQVIEQRIDAPRGRILSIQDHTVDVHVVTKTHGKSHTVSLTQATPCDECSRSNGKWRAVTSTCCVVVATTSGRARSSPTIHGLPPFSFFPCSPSFSVFISASFLSFFRSLHAKRPVFCLSSSALISSASLGNLCPCSAVGQKPWTTNRSSRFVPK